MVRVFSKMSKREKKINFCFPLTKIQALPWTLVSASQVAASRWIRNAVTCWRRAWARQSCSCRAWVRGIGWTRRRICSWWPRWIRSSGIVIWSARDGRVPGRPAAVVWNARTIHRHRLITSSTRLCRLFASWSPKSSVVSLRIAAGISRKLLKRYSLRLVVAPMRFEQLFVTG